MYSTGAITKSSGSFRFFLDGPAQQLNLSGLSAGRPLAALLASNDRYFKAEKLSLKDVRGVIAISGVCTIRLGWWAQTFGKDEAGCRELLEAVWLPA